MFSDQELRYRELEQVARYREALRKNPRLMFLFFELTDKCNMSCLHCGSRCESGKHTFIPKEDVFKVLDETAEKYTPAKIMICITGGEPMLHPDFYEIAEYIVKKGFCWGMTTNGTLINEKAAVRLAEAGLGSVSISLDGLEKEHDFLRNTDGAFQRAVGGIKNLLRTKAYKGHIQVTTVVHRQNISELETIYEFLDSIGIKNWRLTNVDPIGRTLENENLLLNHSEFLYLLDYIKAKRFEPSVKMEVTYGCAHYLTPKWEHMVRNHYFLCVAGTQVAGILCNGDIYSCLDIERRPELVQGNVRRDNFVEIWENKFQIYRKDRTEENMTCKECTDRFVCGADSFHTWDFERAEPRICIKNGGLSQIILQR